MIYSPTTEFKSVLIELDGAVVETDLIETVPDADSDQYARRVKKRVGKDAQGFDGGSARGKRVSERDYRDVQTEQDDSHIDFSAVTTGELLGFVLRKIPHPTDHYAIAATLEMAGMRDVDAQEWFAKDNIFQLSAELYRDFRAGVTNQIPTLPAHEHRFDWRFSPQSLAQTLRAVLPLYFKGLMSNVPWAMQIVCLALFGYAFGVSLTFSRSEATAAAIGMALSLIGTGGFVQTIGRLASFYLGQQNFKLTQQLYFRAVSTGLIVSIGVALALYGVSWFVVEFPPQVAATSAGYYVLFSSMSLCLSLFYVLHHYKGLLGSTLVGIGAMIAVAQFTQLGVQAAHWCGIVATNATALVWLRLHLQNEQEIKKPQHQIPVLPRSAVLSYNIAPYFLAGTLYFMFMFADRFTNWFANAWLNGIALTAIRGLDKPVTMPVAIYPPYEIGLMWAFLAFTLTTPLLEYVMTRFIHVLMPLQRTTVGFDRARFNRTFVQMYTRYTIGLLVCGALLAVWTFDGAVFLSRWGMSKALNTIFTPSYILTEPVYFCAAAGYALMAIALMNNLILFSLSRPWLVVRSLAAGFAVNVLVGWTLSHTVAAWMSVVGLTAGALVAVCISGVYAVRLVRKMDYYYYSAF